METQYKIPFYTSISFILVGLYVLTTMLYVPQSTAVPIGYATIIAMALSQCAHLFINEKINCVILVAAILKVTFDYIDFLRPWGFLIENIAHTPSKINVAIPGPGNSSS